MPLGIIQAVKVEACLKNADGANKDSVKLRQNKIRSRL